MTWVKIKFVVGVSATALLAGGAATIAFSQITAGDNLPPQEIIKKALDKYASLASYSDIGKFDSVRNGKTDFVTTFNIRLERPNLYRIEWEVTDFPAVPAKGLSGRPVTAILPWLEKTGSGLKAGLKKSLT